MTFFFRAWLYIIMSMFFSIGSPHDLCTQILWSDNKELNRWSSLSKAVQYRTRQEEQKDKKRFLKKARNWDKKKAILTSCYTYIKSGDGLYKCMHHT